MRNLLIGLALGAFIGYVVGFSHGFTKAGVVPILNKTGVALDRFDEGVTTFQQMKTSFEGRFDKLIEKLEHPFRVDKNGRIVRDEER